MSRHHRNDFHDDFGYEACIDDLFKVIGFLNQALKQLHSEHEKASKLRTEAHKIWKKYKND